MTILKEVKIQIIWPVENFKNFKIHPHLSASQPVCQPASLPAVRSTSGRNMSPAFSHNAEYRCAITDLLFGLRFTHCAMVSPFILCCFSFSLTDY